jgi:ATP-dependent Clp protease ATP-binding subunit ClpX
MVDIMFNLPDYKRYEIVITKEVIIDKKEPVFIKQIKG